MKADKIKNTKNVGLAFNVIGTILVALAMDKLPGGIGGTTNGIDIVYLVHPIRLQIGLFLIAVGFLLQIDWK